MVLKSIVMAIFYDYLAFMVIFGERGKRFLLERISSFFFV
jgi:hypothetical protein